MSDRPLQLASGLHPAWWLAVPLAMFAGLLVAIGTLPDSGIAWLRSESGPMEWGQAAFFFVAGAVALWLALRAKDAPTWVRAYYLLFGLASLVVTGEELSWGQHLMGFETPEALGGLNKQEEANLHNLWDDLPSRLMRRFLEIGLPILCILMPGWLLWTGKAYGRGTWEWWTLPRLEMAPTLLVAAVGRVFYVSEDWGWPARWHETSSEFSEVFWAYAILLWAVVLAVRVRPRRVAGDDSQGRPGTRTDGR